MHVNTLMPFVADQWQSGKGLRVGAKFNLCLGRWGSGNKTPANLGLSLMDATACCVVVCVEASHWPRCGRLALAFMESGSIHGTRSPWWSGLTLTLIQTPSRVTMGTWVGFIWCWLRDSRRQSVNIRANFKDFWKGGGVRLRFTSKKGGSRRGSNFGPNVKKPMVKKGGGPPAPLDPPMYFNIRDVTSQKSRRQYISRKQVVLRTSPPVRQHCWAITSRPDCSYRPRTMLGFVHFYLTTSPSEIIVWPLDRSDRPSSSFDTIKCSIWLGHCREYKDHITNDS